MKSSVFWKYSARSEEKTTLYIYIYGIQNFVILKSINLGYLGESAPILFNIELINLNLKSSFMICVGCGVYYKGDSLDSLTLTLHTS